MENDTLTIPEEKLSGMVFNFGFYFTIGLFACVGNLLLFAAIYRHKLLRERKGYIILSVVVLLDMLQGYAFAIAGATRISYIWAGTANQLVTRMGCLLKPWNWVWFPFNQCYGATLLMVSVDRLISMSIPILYMSYSRRYTVMLISIFHGPYIPIMFYYGLQSFVGDDRAYISQVCYSIWIYKDKGDRANLQAIRGYFAWASVFLYVAVISLYHSRMKRTLNVLTERSQRQRLETERRLVITLGLSSLATLIFFVSPSMVFSALHASPQLIVTLSPFKALNYVVNPLLFWCPHRFIRQAVYCMFTNQTLTEEMLLLENKCNRVTSTIPAKKPVTLVRNKDSN